MEYVSTGVKREDYMRMQMDNDSLNREVNISENKNDENEKLNNIYDNKDKKDLDKNINDKLEDNFSFTVRSDLTAMFLKLSQSYQSVISKVSGTKGKAQSSDIKT